MMELNEGAKPLVPPGGKEMTGVNVFLHVFEPMEHFLLDGFLDVLELMHDLTYDGTCFEKSLSQLLNNNIYNKAEKLTHLTGEALIRFSKLRSIPGRQVPTAPSSGRGEFIQFDSIKEYSREESSH